MLINIKSQSREVHASSTGNFKRSTIIRGYEAEQMSALGNLQARTYRVGC